MLVPSPAFRSMSLGIMLSVLFVLAATLTLLPAVLAKLGPRVDKFGFKWVHSGEHRSPRFAAWGERLWKRPLAYGALALVVLIALVDPGLSRSRPACPRSRSSRPRTVVAAGLRAGAGGVRPRRPGALQLVGAARRRDRRWPPAAADPGDRPGPPATARPRRGALIQAIPTADPSDPAAGRDVERLREELPVRRPRRWPRRGEPRPRGGARRRRPSRDRGRPGPRLPAAAGRAAGPADRRRRRPHEPARNRSRVRRRKLVFQDGNLQGLLGFDSQGFLDAWGPVFFFAMIFAISMDYTVFLLSSAKEHWDRDGRPEGRDGQRPGPLGPRDLRSRRASWSRSFSRSPSRDRCRPRRWA